MNLPKPNGWPGSGRRRGRYKQPVNARQATRESHENSILKDYTNWLRSKELGEWKIDSQPDPPDGLLTCGGKFLWVELVGLYRNAKIAREIWSQATPGEKPYHHTLKRVSPTPLDDLSARITNEVEKKLEKASYKTFTEKYGPGTLIVSVQDPLFNSKVDSVELEWILERFTGTHLESLKGKNNGKFGDLFLHEPGSPAKFHELCRF